MHAGPCVCVCSRWSRRQHGRRRRARRPGHLDDRAPTSNWNFGFRNAHRAPQRAAATMHRPWRAMRLRTRMHTFGLASRTQLPTAKPTRCGSGRAPSSMMNDAGSAFQRAQPVSMTSLFSLPSQVCNSISRRSSRTTAAGNVPQAALDAIERLPRAPHGRHPDLGYPREFLVSNVAAQLLGLAHAPGRQHGRIQSALDAALRIKVSSRAVARDQDAVARFAAARAPSSVVIVTAAMRMSVLRAAVPVASRGSQGR